MIYKNDFQQVGKIMLTFFTHYVVSKWVDFIKE